MTKQREWKTVALCSVDRQEEILKEWAIDGNFKAVAARMKLSEGYVRQTIKYGHFRYGTNREGQLMAVLRDKGYGKKN